MKLQISPIQAKAELCKRSFFYFVQVFWDVIIPEKPKYNWHIEYLCDELQTIAQRVFDKEPKLYDLIINIPPGTSKSTIATVMFPVWCWIKDPTIRNLTASYSSSLSTDHSVKSRDIVRCDLFKQMFPIIEIKSDQDNKTHYKNTRGGERYATSVSGTVTGFHAHIIIVDDPLNPKGAGSDVDRNSANDFMDITLSTRKVDKSIVPTILVMQRLHENDCTGNWLSKKGKQIKHICLPGELSEDIKPKELKDKYINGLLDTQRLTRDNLDDLKINLGSYGYAGQIMQTPSPLDGGIWQQWFIPIKPKDIPDLTQVGSDFDTAYTKNDTNSASAYVTAGLYDNKMYITDLDFKWLEFPQLINFMNKAQAPYYVEGKASGKSLIQTLTANGIPAIEVKVDGDKISRTTLATPFAESGLIYIADHLINKLYYDSKQGILIFPNGLGDDLNDALVQSIHRLLSVPKFFTF